MVPALPSPQVTVSGAVYRVAAASIGAVNEIVHVGDPGTVALAVTNTDPADGYSENLIASLAGTTGDIGIAAAGPTGDIAAGASDATTLAVGLSTAAAGTVSGNATVALTSDGGTGTGSLDGLGQTSLAPQTVPVDITVDNYAAAGLSASGIVTDGTNAQGGANYTLSLGTLSQGSATPMVDLDALNTAAGPADLLAGSFTESGSNAFTNLLTGFSGVGAGGSRPDRHGQLVDGDTGHVQRHNHIVGHRLKCERLFGGDRPSDVDDRWFGYRHHPARSDIHPDQGTGHGCGRRRQRHRRCRLGTLSAGDRINGGGGTNTLDLVGPGTFNLAAPTTLADIQIITAQEGQPAYSGGGATFAAQNQIAALRSGLDAMVDVSPAASLNAANPKSATITIVGAAGDSSTINLASGNDLVTLGSAAETANLGTGNDTITVNALTIGATIGNGTGQDTLDVTGGGTMAMGANISDIANVLLSPASTVYDFTANALSGLTLDDTSAKTADALIAGGVGQILTGGGAGKITFTGATAGDDTFKNTAALFNGDTVAGFGNNGDVLDLADVNFPALQPLGYVQNNASSGTLTVSDGTHTAAITLFGQFIAADFQPAFDGGTGTDIIYQPPALEAALTTPLHH